MGGGQIDFIREEMSKMGVNSEMLFLKENNDCYSLQGEKAIVVIPKIIFQNDEYCMRYIVGVALMLKGKRKERLSYLVSTFNHYFDVKETSLVEKLKVKEGVQRTYPKHKFFYFLEIQFPKEENIYFLEMNGCKKLVYVRGDIDIKYFLIHRVGEENRLRVKSLYESEVYIHSKYYVNGENNITGMMTDSRILNHMIARCDVGPEVWTMPKSVDIIRGDNFDYGERKIYINHAFSVPIMRNGLYRMMYMDLGKKMFREVEGINVNFSTSPDDFFICDHCKVFLPVECYGEKLYDPQKEERLRVESMALSIGCGKFRLYEPGLELF